MKKAIVLLFALVSLNCFAQEKDQKNEQNYVYCQIVGTKAIMSSKVTIEIDFGQARKLFTDLRLKNSAGKAIKFNSMVDALNYMGAQGWEFVQAYTITLGNTNVYHYLLKKPVLKEELEKIEYEE